jgi:hypothetical protein
MNFRRASKSKNTAATPLRIRPVHHRFFEIGAVSVSAGMSFSLAILKIGSQPGVL